MAVNTSPETLRKTDSGMVLRHRKVKGIPLLAVLIFIISLTPSVFMLLPRSFDAEPVEERRPLAQPLTHWQGSPLDVAANFQIAQPWFNDHVGLRNFMIRAKNEIDYRVFRSSTRVYYGRHGQIFSRNIADRELPASENLLAEPGKIEAIHNGIVRFTNRLQSEGITPIYVFPFMKQYFYQKDMPLIAPRLTFPTNYQKVVQGLLADPRLHVIDTYTPLLPANSPYRTYFLEDFHWTDASAFLIAKEVVGEISKLDGRPQNVWSHPLVVTQEKRQGAEARFAARLFLPPIEDIGIKLDYTKRPQIPLDPKTGFEYETNLVKDPSLLPPTCLFGNSFSDGMLYAGMPVYFQQLIHLDRDSPVIDVPQRIDGKCKYVVVQILDIQPWLLNSFSQQ